MFLSTEDIALKWGVSQKRIQVLCKEGRIKGAKKISGVWAIPANTPQPNYLLTKNNVKETTAEYSIRTDKKKLIKNQIKLNINKIETENKKNNRIIIILIIIKSALQKAGYTSNKYIHYFVEILAPWYTEVEMSDILLAVESTESQFYFKDFSLKDYTNMVSWAYQYINSEMPNDLGKTQFFTDDYMVDYLIDSTFSKEHKKIVDICSGGGNFLVHYFLKDLNTTKNVNRNFIIKYASKLYGYDLDSKIARVAYANIVLVAMLYAKENKIEFTYDDMISVKPNIYIAQEESISGSLNEKLKVVRIMNGKMTPISLKQAIGNADLLLTNPPFLTIKGMPVELKEFMYKEYENSNYDLSAAFLLKSFDYLSPKGKLGLVVQNSWMFLKTLTQFREELLTKNNITSIVNLGSSAFSDLNGEKSSVSLITGKRDNSEKIKYYDLSNKKLSGKMEGVKKLSNKESNLWIELSVHEILLNENYRLDFQNIKGFKTYFYNSDKYKNHAVPMQGTSTGNNKELVDFFWNHFNDDSWILVSKGGGYSRWRGLNRYSVKWGKNAEFIKKEKGSALRNSQYFKQTQMVFSDTGTVGLGVRELLENQIFIASGPGIRIKNGLKYSHLAYLNSRLTSYYIQMLTPKLTISAGYIGNLPVNLDILNSDYLDRLGKICCDLKEHLLSYRPNNFEYNSTTFIEESGSIKDNAIRLFKDDISNQLHQIKIEKKIDDFILEAAHLGSFERNILDSFMGKQTMDFSNTLLSGDLDKLMVSLLDGSCMLKRSKVQQIRYGADNLLEYISREYEVNPDYLYQKLMKNAWTYERTINKYSDLVLHNTIINLLGYDTSKGFLKKSIKIDTVLDYFNIIYSDGIDDLKRWIEERLVKVNKSIFLGNQLLEVTSKEILVHD